MKNYLAIVKSSDNKIDKYMDFDNKSDADDHVATYGGFVADAPDGNIEFWVVNESAKTVTLDSSAATAAQAKSETLAKIYLLEAEITPRRVREAILGTDSDWLKNKEAEIASERSKM